MLHRTPWMFLFLLSSIASCVAPNTPMQSAVDPKVRGRFFSRQEIASSGRTTLADLLRTVPGAQITQRRDGGVEVLFARCRGKMIPRANGDQIPSGTQLFINGTKVQDPVAETGTLRLSDIETIAVYRGPAELPADAMGDGCAAIFVRTRASG